jgi:anti-anti-sigma regulatory factor
LTVTEAASGFGPHDHLCWAYDEFGEFNSAVTEFLGEGLTQGLRVCYIGDGDTATLWNDLRDLDPTHRAAAQVQPLGAAANAVMEPVGQVHKIAAATEDALAAGFGGLRVAVEATPLVRTRDQLDAVARYENLVDRYMIDHPLSVLCGFNRAELGDATIAQLACLHPTVHRGAPPFRLHASSCAAAALSGELDATSVGVFSRALWWADLRPATGEFVIDASELTFIDHRNLFSLAAHARWWNATAVLLGEIPGLAKLIDILDLQDVRIEVPT